MRVLLVGWALDFMSPIPPSPERQETATRVLWWIHNLSEALDPREAVRSPTAAVLTLWASTLLGVAYQLSCISEIYITTHNGSKIAAMK